VFALKNYRSSIPASAAERVVARYPSRAKQRAEYRAEGELVGVRTFHETGELDGEYPEKEGRRHGIVYRCDRPGVVLSAEPYRDGVPHGVAKQWDGGELLGTYTMVRGTGLDLWWQRGESGEPYLSEARFFRDGAFDGFEWWIDPGQRTVHHEQHFVDSRRHGIERRWNADRRLCRGDPRYWVDGERAKRAAYLAASRRDARLPSDRRSDDDPARRFPARGRQGDETAPTPAADLVRHSEPLNPRQSAGPPGLRAPTARADYGKNLDAKEWGCRNSAKSSATATCTSSR